MKYQDQKTHNEVIERVVESETAVLRVQTYFEDHGYQTVMPETQLADCHENWRNAADNGDLYINQRIEVKRLETHFTNRKSWPFPDFMICNKASFDRAKPKPFCYMILNPKMTHAAIVYKSTRFQWRWRYVEDRRVPDHVQATYVCDPDLPLWVEL